MSKKELSTKEKALFQQAMKQVKPLKFDNKRLLKEEKTPYPYKSSNLHQVMEESPAAMPMYLSSSYHQPVYAETVLSYCSKNIDRNRFIALKNGRIRYKARLDLHGLSLEQAQNAFACFLTQADECVLIIHGKGGYHNQCSLLKSFVNHWLRHIDRVLAFHSALPKDGATGAVYVLLKRHQPHERLACKK